jgi:predicted transcriptional regulator
MSKSCHCCHGSGIEQDDYVLGRTMAKKRKAAGISQKDMAGYLKISNSFLAQLEAGTRHWKNEVIIAYGNVVSFRKQRRVSGTASGG